MNIRELLDKRANLVTEARAMLEKADAEKRGLSAEEEMRYNALMEDVAKLTTEIQRREQLAQYESALAQREQPAAREAQQTPEYRFVARGMQGRTVRELAPTEEWGTRLARYASPEFQRGFSNWIHAGVRAFGPEEQRALQADSDILGGYLYAPMQFVDNLIQAVDNMVFMRQLATMYTVMNAETLGAPSLDNDPADPTWTSELLIGTEDSTMSFGRRELNPHPLAKYIKVSRKLLRKVPSAEALVRERLAYKFAVVAENAYLNGTGANQPLGVFTASAQGISTSRDVSTGNTTTSITFGGLKEAKWTLKGQYWPRARWIFHRDALKQIDKLVDGSGAYIWQPSTQVGNPDRLLGFPFLASEYAPNTFTASQYVGILGDFSYYWIADALMMELQRLDELYAATNQVGFIGRLETDGMPVLEEAFVRVKLAAM